MKDYIITEKNQPTFAGIGSGNLDWNGIVDAAESSGCQWFCVEQDTCPGDPFDSLAISFQLDSHKFSVCSERGLTVVRGRRRA